MPLTTTHPDYDSALPDWLRARDVLAGEDAVKAAREAYLPRLVSQTDEDYAAYRQRASFFNATARTAQGYVGLLFRRPPFIKLGAPNPFGAAPASPPPIPQLAPPPVTRHPSLVTFLTDSDLLGTSLAAYAKRITSEVIAVGRAGSRIDWEDTEHRPYLTFYAAENILNWRVERLNGRPLLTLLVLRETAPRHPSLTPPGPPDPFAPNTVPQIRVLSLVPRSDVEPQPSPLTPAPTGTRGSDNLSPTSEPRTSDTARPQALPTSDFGFRTSDFFRPSDFGLRTSPCACLVELYQPAPHSSSPVTRHSSPSSEWTLVESRTPLRFGQPLPLLPFVFHGPSHSRPDIDRPPLSDIIALNLDHYRLDADYKHGLHYTALPTAWVTGFDRDTPLKIGSSTAWMSDLPTAKVGFLEFTGQGLTTFERALDRDERLMALLGSRLLEDNKKVGETAEAIELRQSAEHSVLTTIATSLSESLTQVLRWAFWWLSTVPTPDALPADQLLLKLNTDFSTKGLSSQDLQAIVAAWQKRAISQDTLLELLRKGEILPDTRTNEQEQHLIQASPVGTATPVGTGSTRSPSNSGTPPPPT